MVEIKKCDTEDCRNVAQYDLRYSEVGHPEWNKSVCIRCLERIKGQLIGNTVLASVLYPIFEGFNKKDFQIK